MTRWTVRLLLVLLLIVFFIAILIGIVYESGSGVMRGWLRGEAFYEGMPTSYWQARCDDWLARFESAEDAARGIDWQTATREPDPLISGRKTWVRPKQTTTWTWLGDLFRSDLELSRERFALPPKVFTAGIEAESVLLELATDPRYELPAQRALHNLAVARTQQASEAKP
jgi:hypothetical protein